jgi:PAS domain S-box-containing protein
MEGLDPGALEGSTALLKVALRAAQAGSWAWDLVTEEIFWSDEYHHLIGTDPATVQPSYEAWLEKVHPDDLEPAAAQMRVAIDTRREINLEFRILRPDGLRWLRSQGQILYGQQGEPLKMVGVTFDVTDRRLAEEALRRREEEIRIITDGVPALISYVDAEQRYQFNNRAYEIWFGCSGQELTGKHIRDVLGEAAYQGIRPQIESALAGREARFETSLEYQGAGSRCVDVRYVPDFGTRGEVRGFFTLINDFTERKQTEAALRESEARFRTAVENMLDCMGIYSAVRDAAGTITDFRIDYVNAAACENNAMPREEQIGKLLCEILPGHRESELFADYCRVVEMGEPLIKETLIYEDDYPGQRLQRSFDIRAVKLGDGFMAVWRDVTERKRIEDALKETDRRKDEFLAMLAHELRNPLAPIRNAVEVMRHLGLHSPQLDRMREVIERQTHQLTRMVDDLLDVSRISQGKITLRKEKVDLLTIVGRAVETSRPLIDAGGHWLSVALPADAPRLEGDIPRLAQVFSNLLNNAAKYTEHGGNIWLTAEWQGGEILVRVKDDGIGIPPEVLPRVFDLFAQADRGLDRAQGGLGIGLTLVKSIVEMHGGTVSAFSGGPGQGSEFSVRLPVLVELPYPMQGEVAGAGNGESAAS